MANYIWLMRCPPDPTSLVVGQSPYGTTRVYNFPPPHVCAGGTVTKIPVEAPTIPTPPVWEWKPPDVYQGEPPPPTDFELDPDDGGWAADNPDTDGEDWEFEIDVPIEEGEDPKTVSIAFMGQSIRLGGTIGDGYVYTKNSAGNLCRVSAETGEVIETWQRAVYKIAVSSEGRVIFSSGAGLYLVDKDDITTVAAGGGLEYYHCGFGANNEICVDARTASEGGE